MTTKLLERSETYAKLKEEQERLKAKADSLRQEWLKAADGPDARKAQAALSVQLRAATEEMVKVGPKIAEAKENSKLERRQALLGDPSYKAAALAAADAVSGLLGPWLPLLALTHGAQRAGIAAPTPPASIATLYIETKGWLASMIRSGALDEAHLPALLKTLVKEARNGNH